MSQRTALPRSIRRVAQHLTGLSFFVCYLALATSCLADDGLIAHWPLTRDSQDRSGNQRHAVNHGVTFDERLGAHFDGRSTWLEVPARQVPQLGSDPFTISAWIYTDEDLDDVLGDVMSWYDPTTRNGFNLSLMNYAGVTCAQSNWRNVFFGIASINM